MINFAKAEVLDTHYTTHYRICLSGLTCETARHLALLNAPWVPYNGRPTVHDGSLSVYPCDWRMQHTIHLTVSTGISFTNITCAYDPMGQ